MKSVCVTMKRKMKNDCVCTSDDELLSIDAGVSFGALQQSDPVVHLLRRVCVAVQHTVRSNHDEGVWPVMIRNAVNGKK